MHAPVLSIIVPTRNRDKYAIPCVRSLLTIPSKDLQIVIQDNSETDELEDFIKSVLNDSRLHYAHVRERVDINENFCRGVEASTGEYITFIGDDDGVNPEIVSAARWAHNMNLDALLPTRPAQYTWPDMKQRLYGNRLSGELIIKRFTGRIRAVEAETEMYKCARKAGSSFGNLPKIYYGLIKRSCLAQVKMVTGTYFPGPSPDLAGAMAVANYVKRMYLIDYPLFVPGASAAGVAGWIANKKHQGRLEDYPHLPKIYIRKWSKLVPKFFSGTTIWGEDVVQALLAVNRTDILSNFNLPLLHAKCVAFNPRYSAVALRNLPRALREQNKSLFVGLVMFVYYYIYLWVVRGKHLIINVSKIFLKNKKGLIKPVENIEYATLALTQLLKNYGYDFGSLDRLLT